VVVLLTVRMPSICVLIVLTIFLLEFQCVSDVVNKLLDTIETIETFDGNDERL
jgi:hypothetical protein